LYLLCTTEITSLKAKYGVKLQSTKLEEMPKYIIENTEKYRPWLDS